MKKAFAALISVLGGGLLAASDAAPAAASVVGKVMDPLDWAMVQDADLKPFGDVQHPEVHGTYIDIQAPITGPETIGLLAITPEARAAIAFDAKKDIGFFDAKTEPATLQPGEFAVLMPPLGAHAPCRSLDGARRIRKLVIKIRN